MTTETRVCSSCKGTKVRVQEAFTYTDSVTGESRSYPRKESACISCKGLGEFSPPCFEEIWGLIKGRKGLRSAPPKGNTILCERAYYVWRMARFHGGKDMTMPVCAGLKVHGDSFVKELDAMADKVAKESFGSNMTAARRWGSALGYL